MNERETIRFRSESRLSSHYQELIEQSDVVVSAPGTVFLAGEKAIVHGAKASCMKIGRRLFVGLERVGEPPGLSLEKSEVLTLDPDQKCHRFRSYDGRHDRLRIPLVGAATAFQALTGRALPGHYNIRVLSEWEGEYGLGWSSAFSAGLAQALAIVGGVTNLVAATDPVGQRVDHETDWVMRLGWCIDAVLHGGRASGSGVFGSLSSWATPYRYWVDRGEDMPILWQAGAEEDKV